MAVFLQVMLVLLCAMASVQAASPSQPSAIQESNVVDVNGEIKQTMDAAPACPADWMHNAGKCYYSTAPETMNFDQCRSYCGHLRATLPCVMNAQDNSFLGDIPIPRGTTFLWGIYLGLNDIVTEGDFQWQKGCASTYRNFATNEPNDYKRGEDCVTVRNHTVSGVNFGTAWDGSAMWNDIPCASPVICVCEKPAVGSPPVPVVSPPTLPKQPAPLKETVPVDPVVLPPVPEPEITIPEVDCPEGWDSQFGKCYLTTLPKQDYSSCVSSCARHEATLPCVMNAAENDYIATLFPNIVHLGLIHHVTEDRYEWQAGCPSTYSNFTSGEPNEAHKREANTAWNDIEPTDVANCVCEKQPTAQDLSSYSATAPLHPVAASPALETASDHPFACPEGWESQFGKCYLPTPKKVTHPECVSHCTGLGATLPCVTSAAESLYLVGLYPKDLEFCAFIGYNDIATEGKFEWQEGCTSTFVYFARNEPNNYHNEDCVSVCLRGDKMWNDLPCLFETYCVCEKSEGTGTAGPIVALPPVPEVTCPEGWQSQFGKCYLTTLPKQNYTSCLSTCTIHEATLPCVMSVEESLYLARLSPSHDMLFCAFLGLNDIATEGKFEWQEGCASTFTYFLPGEPNNYNNGEDCVSGCFQGNKMWNDMSCGAETQCVCEKTGDSVAPVLPPPTPVLKTAAAVTAPTSESTCPAGWAAANGKCYLTTSPKQDYASCLATCTGFGATLPCVMNAAQSLYIAGLFPTTTADSDPYTIYLGLNDIVTEGTFQWQAGCSSSYTNWSAGEPNEAHGGEDCSSVFANGRTTWIDVRCNTVAYCVCENPALTPTPTSAAFSAPLPATSADFASQQCTCADCAAHYSTNQPRAAHACSFYCYKNC